ncbi:MAG: hypothetical protein JW951_01290 [Lentisphaerae bacterium]|nr:hypothetical protein [Lentisphaerota bacterium]
MTCNRHNRVSGLICGLVAAGLVVPAGEPCAAPRPVRVVCIGDSLTACGGRGGRYTDWLAVWLPEAEIVNKGIGGDTLAGGRARFRRDVLDLDPDAVVIELGANDFWQAERPIEALAADLEHMVRAARNAGIEVVLASCFGDAEAGDASGEFRMDRRRRYALGISRFERDIAARYDCAYVPNMQVDIKPVDDFPECWDDRRHPNRAGNKAVARRILAALRERGIRRTG